MSEEKPPIQAPIQSPVGLMQDRPTDADFIADKIGFLPNTRKSDNAFQAKFILATCAISILVSFFAMKDAPWWGSGVIGLVIGLVVGVLISGTILAVRNIRR